jgi:hypothetical protein
MSKNLICIGTTALNRPDLHSVIFPDWITYINTIDRELYDIKWFINIDVISHIAHTYDETVNNLTKLNDNVIDLTILSNKDNKHGFLKACKNLSQCIVSYIDTTDYRSENIKILWLEDDWKLNMKNKMDINHILYYYCNPLTYVSFTAIGNNFLHALAPSILPYDMWKINHYGTWKNTDSDMDPEHCAGLVYRRNYGRPNTIKSITIINRHIDDYYFKCPTTNFHNYKTNFFIYNIKNYDCGKQGEIITDDKVKEISSGRACLIRIYPPICRDIGRKYMNEKGIFKVNKEKRTSSNFYEFKK